MICTDDENLYYHLLLLRSHGLLRELPDSEKQKRKILDIDERFTFLCPGYNLRNTDLHAVLGIEQMKRLESAVTIREKNFKYYLNKLNKDKYISDFNSEGVSLFAFPIITKNKNIKKIIELLNYNRIDNRPLIAGNLFRHPMMNSVNTFRNDKVSNFIHDNGLYVGNNEFVTENDIDRLTFLLNSI
jgi:CDP-6-deoxy-D-xylo-4-hexulose-3-dehydrase